MASECSFDIVSQFDEQELVNALDQTRREVQTRFDLKDTKTEITHSKDTITISTESEMTLKSVRDILETKAIRRGLSLKIFKYGKEEAPPAGACARPSSSSRVSRRSWPKRSISISGTTI